jgi:acyl-CoA reductase-like NAD-dependent aldehyde dehydrogenase
VTIVRDSFYINGEWVKATSGSTLEVTTSGTGELYATDPEGTVAEANAAVDAAAAAFTSWSLDQPEGARRVPLAHLREVGRAR